jgi:general secretion pathway protein A
VYERFFHLRERPFSLSPDPEYLYPSRVHTEALSYLRYGIEGHAGFIVITGEIGSGKTTLLQTALRGVHKSTAVSRLVNTMLDARDLLEAVMLDFDLDPPPEASKPRLLRTLSAFLVEQRRAGRIALLVIDEAQNLSLAALEEVRMLSNLETEKSKLIQIALVGQPDLRARLARPELEQLRQRVTVSYHLPALDCSETDAYINHRLSRAALSIPPAFPRAVTELVHRHSQGVPRRINVIADAILLYAYGEGRRTIDRAVAEGALSELRTSGILPADTLPAEARGAVGARAGNGADASAPAAPVSAAAFDPADLAQGSYAGPPRVAESMSIHVAAPVAAAIGHAPVINGELSWPTSGRVLVASTPPLRESMWTRFTRGLFNAVAADSKL